MTLNKTQNNCLPEFENARYGSLEELKDLLLYKRIVEWDKDFCCLKTAQRSLLKCLKVIVVHQQMVSLKM